MPCFRDLFTHGQEKERPPFPIVVLPVIVPFLGAFTASWEWEALYSTTAIAGVGQGEYVECVCWCCRNGRVFQCLHVLILQVLKE